MRPTKAAFFMMSALLYAQGALGAVAVAALVAKQLPSEIEGYGVAAPAAQIEMAQASE